MGYCEREREIKGFEKSLNCFGCGIIKNDISEVWGDCPSFNIQKNKDIKESVIDKMDLLSALDTGSSVHYKGYIVEAETNYRIKRPGATDSIYNASSSIDALNIVDELILDNTL